MAKKARLGFVTPIGMSAMLSIAAVIKYSSNSAWRPSQTLDPAGCAAAAAGATAGSVTGGAGCPVTAAGAWVEGGFLRR